MIKKSKYKSRQEWAKADPKMYKIAQGRKIISHFCRIFGWDGKKEIGYWTMNRCIADAKKYTTIKEWRKKMPNSYSASHRNGWLSECKKHMLVLVKPVGYWTEKHCIEEAIKYKTVTEWQKKCSGSYASARINEWIPKCTKHMVLKYKPHGYWNLKKCQEDALMYKTKSEWGKKSASAYATAMKNKWLDKCCKHMISAHKPNGFWTLSECKIDAKKYKTIKEWQKNSTGYSTAYKRGWIKKCCIHMKRTSNEPGYWTKERCLKSALKYNRRDMWATKDNKAYLAARRAGFADYCCKHMGRDVNPPNYWTLKTCKEDALKYKTRSEWNRKSPTAYMKAADNGWREECCFHMEHGRELNRIWTKERCIESAKRYTTISEWINKKPSAYHAAINKGWSEECTKHMVSRIKPHGYWTEQQCIEDARKYKTQAEWKRHSSGGLTIAFKKGWFKNCVAHMLNGRSLKRIWTLEKCKKDALKHKTKMSWKNSKGGYARACKNGWLIECTKHMKKK